MTKNSGQNDPAAQFAQQSEQPQPGLVREFWDFLCENKKWWLTPIIVVLLLVTLLALISSMAPAAAPFIYTVF
jgi:hypothetical protein